MCLILTEAIRRRVNSLAANTTALLNQNDNYVYSAVRYAMSHTSHTVLKGTMRNEADTVWIYANMSNS